MTDTTKQLVVLGAAESGVGAALLAQAKGYAVFVSDRGTILPAYKEKLTNAGIEFEENQHTMERILQAQEVIKSPGIPEKAVVVKALREQQIPIYSEIEFASRYTKARFVAITGTNGKTTTTLLTYHLLRESGFSVGLAGNIGYSLAEQVLEDKFEYYVLELSSFQLDDIKDFHPWISVLLNITPDHLDRYDYSLEKYANAKLRIAENLGLDDYLIYNADDENTGRFLKTAFLQAYAMPFSLHHRSDFHLAAYYEDDFKLRLHLPIEDRHPDEVSIENSPLIGLHNRQNMSAAILAARIAGASPEQIEQAFLSFQNADHRLQLVDELAGVQFINDSKATNVEAAWYALDGIKKSIVWIAGGTDKGNDYSTLVDLANQKVKALVCLGVDNAKLRTAFESAVPHLEETQSMTDAVRRAAALATPGDVVLLSPACASFDLFKNYEDRGQQFAAAVQELNSSQPAKSV
jgi:UDP-N-acetylmuramoylalanine--D-glutamate ligase